MRQIRPSFNLLDSLLQEVSEISCGGLLISDYISGDCVVSVVDTVLGFPASTCEREEEGDLGACGVSAWLAGLWWLAG